MSASTVEAIRVTDNRRRRERELRIARERCDRLHQEWQALQSLVNQHRDLLAEGGFSLRQAFKERDVRSLSRTDADEYARTVRHAIATSTREFVDAKNRAEDEQRRRADRDLGITSVDDAINSPHTLRNAAEILSQQPLLAAADLRRARASLDSCDAQDHQELEAVIRDINAKTGVPIAAAKKLLDRVVNTLNARPALRAEIDDAIHALAAFSEGAQAAAAITALQTALHQPESVIARQSLADARQLLERLRHDDDDDYGMSVFLEELMRLGEGMKLEKINSKGTASTWRLSSAHWVGAQGDERQTVVLKYDAATAQLQTDIEHAPGTDSSDLKHQNDWCAKRAKTLQLAKQRGVIFRSDPARYRAPSAARTRTTNVDRTAQPVGAAEPVRQKLKARTRTS